MTISLKPDEGIFGLPPLNELYVSKHVVLESMPIAEIIPCKPNFSSGMTLFNVIPDTDTYDDILKNLGYKVDHPIKVAFLADNFPTDSFSNDYGETFLQKFTDVGSQAMGQLAQMTGSQDAIGGITKLGKGFAEMGKEVGGTMGSLMSGGGGMVTGAGASMAKLRDAMKDSTSGIGKMMGGGADIVSKMMAGQRVDFPNVWRNSGFSPSYTMTIRLFNPYPGDPDSTVHHIIGPLAVLLSLSVPRTTDGHTYSWPFLHKIKCPGIFVLDPAAITNITVIKGGDQQQIAWNQKLGLVDVRIDFTSLYNSMVTEEGDASVTNRPTLNNYLATLEEGKEIKNHYENSYAMSGLPKDTSEQKETPSGINIKSSTSIAQTSHGISPRVPIEDMDISSELIDKTQSGIYET